MICWLLYWVLCYIGEVIISLFCGELLLLCLLLFYYTFAFLLHLRHLQIETLTIYTHKKSADFCSCLYIRVLKDLTGLPKSSKYIYGKSPRLRMSIMAFSRMIWLVFWKCPVFLRPKYKSVMLFIYVCLHRLYDARYFISLYRFRKGLCCTSSIFLLANLIVFICINKLIAHFFIIFRHIKPLNLSSLITR